ncbi:MAG: CBS domain-containing protein [Candidatus Omnitrophica bacterium]|nr:CBS domain-containing protein [Candidatus Omnitrophota bacterium]
MDLITTHVNADFDALGSLVAAKKLYPQSRLLLPGSQEEAVREFLSLARELVAVESERECRLDDIDRLVLVDTKQKARIGIAAELVDRGVEVHVYDHHPRMKGDVVADKDVYEEVGATVTILSGMIKKRKIKLSYLEATIMLLGIYEETGSLTYRSTTKFDVDMVSFLFSQGANLSVVSSYLNREVSREGLSLLTKLINLTERVEINGVSVSLVEIDAENYVSDLGALMQKLMELENINILFVLIKSPGGKVDIIARSRVPALDVNKVLSLFGGGGHPGAASAKTRGIGIVSIRQKLFNVLKSKIKVAKYAKDIMSKGVKAMSANEKVFAARATLTKNNLDGMPVTQKGRVVGIITLNGLNKAIKRSFGHSRVKGYMTREFVTVSPDTPLHILQKMLFENPVGVFPVTRGKKVVGVINRTALLRSVHGTLFAKPPVIDRNVTLNLAKKMSAVLPADVMALARKIGRKANSLNYTAFIVGGLVRDLILGVKNLDLDIVIEGPAIKMGEELAKDLGAALIIHRRFGTCTLITKATGYNLRGNRVGYRVGCSGFKIDLATARREVYERPAALPTVEFSSLKDDLVRRDFTINAMALSLNKESFGRLIDFFGGERDLARGVIKVMHDASFIDDPTRVFRAVRFEQRFGFTIDPHTEDLIKNAIKIEMFDKVEPQRIRDELIAILKEDDPCRAVRRMSELDELRFLHPKIKFDSRIVKLCRAINSTCDRYDGSIFRKRSVERWLIYLMALFDRLSYNDVSSICSRFALRRSETIRLLSCKEDADKAAKALASASAVSPSIIYRILEPLSFEVILFITSKAFSPKVAARVEDFFRKLNGARVNINGADIASMGLSPCPEYKTILDKVLYAKLDGKVKTRKAELELTRKLVKKFMR